MQRVLVELGVLRNLLRPYDGRHALGAQRVLVGLGVWLNRCAFTMDGTR